MGAVPPAEFAPLYASMRREYPPPPAVEVARAPVGTRVYPEPPAGCYWASSRLFWTPVAGDALFFVHGLDVANNGHKEIASALVDLRKVGQELDGVALPSSTLSRDLSGWTGRWVAVRVRRDGRRQPWRAVPITHGMWSEHADALNAAA
ncbi:hypothetical protein BGK67_25140 [Streptomyces subrutilus]|uniref:Uncharacterized protein n=1 Tax=Streptomyces subrutilus TaxID=36818 RepID=A0A1E5PXG1_9ACTN|nr:hypothetical protein BGK67_25140 [Streptomyces subrutilus]